LIKRENLRGLFYQNSLLIAKMIIRLKFGYLLKFGYIGRVAPAHF